MYAETLLNHMAPPQIHATKSRWSHGLPLITDSFAGGGGASTGIEMALGRSPDIAINHNAAALALHGANHPDTLHLSENIYKVDPLDYVAGQHIGLSWFSPDCKDFSKAKGGKPVERNIRDLAHVIPFWVERVQKSGGKIDVVMMENVEEFSTWGPLLMTDKGLRPDPARMGETFQKWCRKLRSLGGKIERRELRGCDYGAPTIRKRLFIIIRFDGCKIIWPKSTHGSPDDRDVIAGRKLPWRTAAECIDWSIACPSIFDSSDDIRTMHGVNSVRPLAYNTMARVARGMHRYVINAERPFLVNLTHGGRCEDLAQPFKTVTGAHRGEKALILPHVCAFYGPGKGGKDRSASMTTPLRVVTTENRHAVIAPVLTAAQHGGSVRPINSPAHTIAASRKDQNSVMCAFVAQHNTDRGGPNPGRRADVPLSTITQRGTQQNIVSAFVARQFGTSTGHAIDRPSATVMADGAGKSQLVTPFLQAYYGTGDGGAENAPMRTVTTKDRHGHVQAVLDIPPFTEAQAERARTVADFMRSHGFWDDREFVTLDIDGSSFVIVDIGMRMLTPRELYNAQGFPPDYVIDGVWADPGVGHNGGPMWVPFSKSVQVSCVGNSVCPPLAEALVAANCNHLMVRQVAA